MGMIAIFPPYADDFSSNGLGLLLPTECTIAERENGMYELKLIHPITDDMRWTLIQNGCIVRADAPMRESPLYELDALEGAGTATVTRKLYVVDVRTRLRLRAKPNTSSKILGRYKKGTEVVQLEDVGDNWFHVSIRDGGATGYMYAGYLDYVKDITETITSAQPVSPEGVTVLPAREQLFRIHSVEVDSDKHTVTAQAMHIFYDLRGNPVKTAYAPENTDANAVAHAVFGNTLDPHDFELFSYLSGTVTGDYGYKSPVECLLGPDDGILAQTGGIIVRDNFDVFLLPAEVRDRGVTIRRGKNLVGVQVTTDSTDVVTRIIPVGKNKDGDDLFLDGTIYVDSPNIAKYPTIYAKRIDYDVRVGKNEGQFSTEALARAELRRLAEADFAAGIDAATYGMDVDFISLENTAEYADYASLQAVHIHDTVTVIDELVNLRTKLRITGYEWDVLGRRYNFVSLGNIVELEQVTYGYTLADGTVSGSKIIPGSVDGSTVLRNMSVNYAKIAQAAIEQLSANAITAMTAHINEIVAGNITTDQLYVDLAFIAAAQITTANIKEANIDWAQIATLTAQIATITRAEITQGNIKWAEIESLNAAIASIAQAKIEDAEITSAQITDLQATVAKIFTASIGSADIGYAQIKDLITQQAIITEGVGGQLYIARLAVTEANMVSLSVGELMVKGEDGRFYTLGVGPDGKVKTTLKQVENADVADKAIHGTQKLIEGSITAQVLNAQNIFGDSAIIRELIAANLDVDTLFAREATVKALNAVDIRGNEYLKLSVEGKSTVYRGERPPAGGSANDLFIQNSTGYTFQRVDAGAMLPEFYIDETGILYYRYADGQAAYQLYMDANGDLHIEDNPYLTLALAPDGTPEWWTRVKDSQLEREAQEALQAAQTAQATANQNAATITEHAAAIDLNKRNIELRVTSETFNKTVGDLRESISSTEAKIDVKAGEVLTQVGKTYATQSDLNATNESVKTAQAAIQTNTDQIALKVGTAQYTAEKIYRSNTAPSTPLSNMMWLDTSLTPAIMKRWNGSAWAAVGAQEVKTSGVAINDRQVAITTEDFLLQLLDPANNESVLMEMSADGNVGFNKLYAEEIVSDSVAQAYMGPSSLYIDPSYTGDDPAYFRSLSDAMKTINYKYLRGKVNISLYYADAVYDLDGVTITGLFGPGNLTIYGANKTLNAYLNISGCCSRVYIYNLYLRESRGEGAQATRLISIDECRNVEFSGCTFDGNNVSSLIVSQSASSTSFTTCEFYNATRGIQANRGDAFVNSCKGSLTTALIASTSTIYASGTIPGGNLTKIANGQIYADGTTVDYGSATPPVQPEVTAAFTADTTRTYRGGWRTDTQDVIQGAYAEGGYQNVKNWNYGGMWFSTLRSALSGKTVKSATITLKRIKAGANAARSIYLCALTNTSPSGSPVIAKEFGVIGTLAVNKQGTFALPTDAVQGLADGTYGALAIYETPYNFGSGNYSSGYMRIHGANSDTPPMLTVVYS